MCRDQNLISETSERADGRASERMKIEKPGVGRPLLGPAKIDYVIVIKNFLNPKGHQNPISGSKLTAI